MAIKKFRRGETTYTCQCCKKLTRNTGGDERQCGLCLDCFDLAGIENHLTDNGAESMRYQYGEEVQTIFARRPELVALHSDLVAALEGK